MAKDGNLVWAYTGTTGTGTITLGAALTGYFTFAQGQTNGDFNNGDALAYTIIDGANREQGTGVWSSSANTLTRTLRRSTTGALLNLSGAATVVLSYAAEDIAALAPTAANIATGLGYTPANQNDTTDLLNSVSYLALMVGSLKGALGQLTDGFDDNFVDETGIDTGNSSGLTWAAGSVANYSLATSGPVTMTGASTPSGYSANATSGGTTAWQAFDKSTSTTWQSAGYPASTPQALQISLPSAIFIGKYAISIGSSNNSAPSTWTLQGANSLSGPWTTLDSQSGITWSTNTTKTFSINNPQKWSCYQLVTSAVPGGSSQVVIIAELALLQATVAALTLQSLAPVTLKSAPSRVGVYVLAAFNGVINTDLIGSVSRDGSTFTSGTFVAIATIGGLTLYELQGSDGLPGVIVTGQPSGTTPKYRLVTTANYLETINGVTLRAA